MYTNITFKVRFRGEFSKSFKIRTDVRRGGGLSPIFFNWLLEKVICELISLTDGSELRIGYKKGKLTVNCLAVAYHLTHVTCSAVEAIRQLSWFNHIAVNIELGITNIRDATVSISLEDTVSLKASSSNTSENVNSDISEPGTRGLNASILISNMDTTVPAILYALEWLNTVRKKQLRRLESKDRKIVRTKHGPRQRES